MKNKRKEAVIQLLAILIVAVIALTVAYQVLLTEAGQDTTKKIVDAITLSAPSEIINN